MYNQCLNAMKSEEYRALKNKKKQFLRSKFVHDDNYKNANNNNTWVRETPYQIRDDALSDLFKALKSTLAAGHDHFEMKFRSKKNPSESIVIPGRAWNKGIIFKKYWGNKPIRTSEPVPDKLNYDFRIVKNRLGEFYLCLPEPLNIRGENQAPTWEKIEDGILSLDPGVRTFCTGYCPSGMSVEWGKADIGRIYRLCHSVDKLQSLWSQQGVKHRKRYRLQRAARRVRRKIRNLIDEVHKKFTRWIVDNFHTVLLPEFQTQRMVQRGQRRIRSSTARAMLTWSHYRFRMRLMNKVREHPWCKVILCDEAFTSKTCGNCGRINNQLGPKKVFKCPNCQVEMDRDINAARNILIRYLTLRSVNRIGLRSGLGLPHLWRNSKTNKTSRNPALGLTPLEGPV